MKHNWLITVTVAAFVGAGVWFYKPQENGIDWNKVIGVIGGIAIPPYIALVLQSRKKSLSYAVSDTPIISIDGKARVWQ